MSILTEVKHYKQRKEIVTEIESRVIPVKRDINENRIDFDHFFTAEIAIEYNLCIDGEVIGSITQRECSTEAANQFECWSDLMLSEDLEKRWPGLEDDLRNISEHRPPERFVRFIQHTVVRYFMRQAAILPVFEENLTRRGCNSNDD